MDNKSYDQPLPRSRTSYDLESALLSSAHDECSLKINGYSIAQKEMETHGGYLVLVIERRIFVFKLVCRLATDSFFSFSLHATIWFLVFTLVSSLVSTFG